LIIIAFLVASAQRPALASHGRPSEWLPVGVLLKREVIIDFAWLGDQYQAHSLTRTNGPAGWSGRPCG